MAELSNYDDVMTTKTYPQSRITVYICATCDVDRTKTDTPDARSGLEFLKQVRKWLRKSDYADAVILKSVKCLGACENACNVGLTAPDKQACIFTQFSPNKPEELEPVLKSYLTRPQGKVKYADLPKNMRTRFMCRIPKALTK